MNKLSNMNVTVIITFKGSESISSDMLSDKISNEIETLSKRYCNESMLLIEEVKLKSINKYSQYNSKTGRGYEISQEDGASFIVSINYKVDKEIFSSKILDTDNPYEDFFSRCFDNIPNVYVHELLTQI